MDLSLNSYAIMQKGNGNKLKKVVFCNKILYTFHDTDIIRTVIFHNIISFLIYGYDGFLLSCIKIELST